MSRLTGSQRSVHFEHGPDEHYWNRVDEELISTRKDAGYDDATFSLCVQEACYHRLNRDADMWCSFIQQSLERDRVLFPSNNWKEVDRTKPTTSQTEMDTALREKDMSSMVPEV